MSTTLYDKIWNDHLVDQQDDGTALLFVDRHLVLSSFFSAFGAVSDFAGS